MPKENMKIDDAIQLLNDISIHFIWNPGSDKPLFEKASNKMVRINNDMDIFQSESNLFHFDEIIQTAEEVAEYKVIGKGKTRTKSYFYQIVKPTNKSSDFFRFGSKKISFQCMINGFSITLQRSPLIHAVCMINAQSTSRIYPFAEYSSVVQLELGKKAVSDQECDVLISKFLFELEGTYGLNFIDSDFRYPDRIDFTDFGFPSSMDMKNLENINNHLASNNVPDYDSQAIELYKASKDTDNEEIKLILLYKVFEYFGPAIIRYETHEALGKRLTSPKVLDPDSDFLTSVINLVNKYQGRSNDGDMLKEVFKRCTDLEILQKELPKYLQNSISNKTDFKEFSVRIAKILYATRNSIVHAKSNFENQLPTCPVEDLHDFNRFLSM